MQALLLLLAVLGSGRHVQPTTSAALIEVNHQDGFTQVIAWEWSPDWNRLHVMGWELVESDRRLPQKRAGKGYEVTIRGERFYSDRLRESWGCETEDPERVNRRVFDPAHRWQVERSCFFR